MKTFFSFQIILLLFGFSHFYGDHCFLTVTTPTPERTLYINLLLWLNLNSLQKCATTKYVLIPSFGSKMCFFAFSSSGRCTVHLATMACRGSYSFPYLAKRNSTHKKIFLLNSNLTLERFEEFQNKISLLANKEQLSLRNSLVLGNSGKRRIFKRC